MERVRVRMQRVTCKGRSFRCRCVLLGLCVCVCVCVCVREYVCACMHSRGPQHSRCFFDKRGALSYFPVYIVGITIMFVRDSCSKQLDSDRLAADVPELGKCSANATSADGAHSEHRCFCDLGFWRGCSRTNTGSFINNTGQPCVIDWTAPCAQCRANDICFNDTLLHCPEHSVSGPGSSEPSHCQCLGGFAAEYKMLSMPSKWESNLSADR